jgi:hypothetical protein
MSFTVATPQQYAHTRRAKPAYQRWTHSFRTAMSSWRRCGSGSSRHSSSTRRSTTASTSSSTSWLASGHGSTSCTVQLCRSMSWGATNSAPSSLGQSRSREKIGDVAYMLQLPTGARLHDVFHVGLLKKFYGEAPATLWTLPTIRHGRACPTLATVLRRRLA